MVLSPRPGCTLLTAATAFPSPFTSGNPRMETAGTEAAEAKGVLRCSRSHLSHNGLAAAAGRAATDDSMQ
jgi:hypothetical protein